MQSDEKTRQAPHEPYAAAEHSTDEEHIHLPPPSIWPITMALGIALGMVGVVFTYVVSALGLILAVAALVNWIQELRHESH